MNPNELGLLERLPVPTEAPFPDLGSCQGPERSLGLVICECVLKDICTYIREVPLLAGEGGILVMTEVIVTAGATPCSLCRAGSAQGLHMWPWEVERTGHEPSHRSTACPSGPPRAPSLWPRHCLPCRPEQEGRRVSSADCLSPFLPQTPTEWTAPRCWVKRTLILISPFSTCRRLYSHTHVLTSHIVAC